MSNSKPTSDKKAFTAAQLWKITEDSTMERKWLSTANAKAEYCMGNSIFYLISEYDIPMIQPEKDRHALVSIPALEAVLCTAKELRSTSAKDTYKQQYERAKEDALAEAKAQMIADYKEQLAKA